MEWHCIHIEHARLERAINVTLRNMLFDEWQARGMPKCGVFRHCAPTTGCTYFFSPEASEVFAVFIGFWQGVSCSEPANLQDLDLLI